jgi:apolipoprotein D and lipocalin family protein
LGQYAVLDTDYENWSAVYSCQGLGPLYIEFAWLLARERNATEENVNLALAQYEKFGIDITKFYDTEQSEDCVYDP